MLRGEVALVTGASRGIGRGIALQLAEAGATVYVTGREPKKSDSSTDSSLPTLEETAQEVSKRGGVGIAVYCDHSNADDVKRLFERIQDEQNGRLYILVNNAFSAVNLLMDIGDKQFWQLDPLTWDEMNNVGLRNHYICSVYAARMMIPRNDGLIVNVSSISFTYLFGVAYGAGKAALDRIAVDIALELKQHNITAISLWPGPVRTEIVIGQYDKQITASFKESFENGETPEYAGRGVVHLAADKNRLRKSGRTWLTVDLADEYGFTDIDERHPANFRSLKELLKMSNWTKTAWFIPNFIKVPGWLLSAFASKV